MLCKLKLASSSVFWVALLGAPQACPAAADDPVPVGAVAVNEAGAMGNPYSAIAERNVFHLNPPPPSTNHPTAPALPDIFLTGFMRAGECSKVLLVVKSQNPKLHAPNLPSYLCLGEGQKQTIRTGDRQVWVEVVAIHVKEEKVDIISFGTPSTLSFKEDGLKVEAPPPVVAEKSRESLAKATHVLLRPPDPGDDPALPPPLIRVFEQPEPPDQPGNG